MSPIRAFVDKTTPVGRQVSSCGRVPPAHAYCRKARITERRRIWRATPLPPSPRSHSQRMTTHCAHQPDSPRPSLHQAQRLMCLSICRFDFRCSIIIPQINRGGLPCPGIWSKTQRVHWFHRKLRGHHSRRERCAPQRRLQLQGHRIRQLRLDSNTFGETDKGVRKCESETHTDTGCSRTTRSFTAGSQTTQRVESGSIVTTAYGSIGWKLLALR